MKNIYYLFLGLMTIMGFAACNNEWEDEQYLLQASFKANVTDQGVTTTYVRFNCGGVVKYNLPIFDECSTAKYTKFELFILVWILIHWQY